MYFILSKVLLFLILPISWITVLLLIAVISKEKKRKQTFLLAAIIVLYIFSNSFLLDQFAKRWDIQPTVLNNIQPYSCAIILGGFSGSDAKDNGYFNTASDRFVQGVKLFTTKKTSRLLVSSGNGNLIPGAFREAAWVKTQLLQFNVPDSAILIENNSKNTFENAKFSKALLEQAHLEPPYLLVTSAFHMRRSLMIFKKAGISVIPYPCNYISGRGWADLFIPNADALSGWNFYIKEVIGYVVNYLK